MSVGSGLVAVSSVARGSKNVKDKVKQVVKLAVLHGAAFVRSRPFLKCCFAGFLMRFPFVRARLVRFAGAGVMQGLLVNESFRVVDSEDQLTARGRAVYVDLLAARRSTIKK